MRTAVFCVVYAVMSSALWAQTPGAPTDATTVLRPEMTVWITDTSGREQRGRVIKVTPELITLAADGDVRQMRASEVTRIRERQGDPVWHGAVVGAGVMLATGLSLCRLMEPWDACDDPGPIVQMAAVGGGIGVAVDALVRGRRTVYEAPRRGTSVRVVPIHRGLGVSLEILR